VTVYRIVYAMVAGPPSPSKAPSELVAVSLGVWGLVWHP
jgi:hypothetical protein